MIITIDSNEYALHPQVINEINKILVRKKEKAKTSETTKLYEENKIITKKLECGDYQFNNILIEHKTISDYCGSIMSNHLFQQVQDMIETQKQFPDIKLFVIISGNPTDILSLEHPVNPDAMLSAWASLSKNINVSFVGNTHFFVVGMINLFEKFYDGKIRNYSPIRKAQEFDDIILSNYCSLVGEKTARKLMEKFPYPKLLYNASKEQLLEVEGIGKDTAEFLLNVIEGKEKSWKVLEEKKKIIKENKIAIKEAKRSKDINKDRDSNRDSLLPDFI